MISLYRYVKNQRDHDWNREIIENNWALENWARQKAFVNPLPMMQAPPLAQLEHALRLVHLDVECGLAMRYLGERDCEIHDEDLQQSSAENLQ